jgi:pantetheine-phosphate adenylyltransferase
MGHLDIITRASRIFDRLIVAVLQNPRKHTMFTPEERVEFIRKVTKDIPNVEADTSKLLLADYAEQKGTFVIVKGMRAVSDFEHEFQMALTNRKLNPKLDTLFLTTNYKYLYLSSSIVKEIGSLGGDISDFVPVEILREVTDRLNSCGKGE